MTNKPSQGNRTTAPKDNLQGAYELLKLAAKVGHLADHVSHEPAGYRIAGRVNRFIHSPAPDLKEQELTALAEAHVYLAKIGDDPFVDSSCGFFLLQSALAQESYRLWEGLWNDNHPDRFGQPWEGEDFALMSVWREKVRGVIKECRQEAVLAMTGEEYVAKLIAAGADEHAAEDLSDWLSEVTYESEGTTGST